MIGEHDWYAVPNDEVETWCLLTLNCNPDKDLRIEAWEMGFGNSTQIVRRVNYALSQVESEEELIQQLLVELEEPRYTGVTLITPSENTLSILRSRILCHPNISDTGFRGFAHFELKTLLSRYFNNQACHVEDLASLSDDIPDDSCFDEWVDDCKSVDDLWLFIQSILPLVPRKELQGEPL